MQGDDSDKVPVEPRITRALSKRLDMDNSNPSTPTKMRTRKISVTETGSSGMSSPVVMLRRSSRAVIAQPDLVSQSPNLRSRSRSRSNSESSDVSAIARNTRGAKQLKIEDGVPEEDEYNDCAPNNQKQEETNKNDPEYNKKIKTEPISPAEALKNTSISKSDNNDTLISNDQKTPTSAKFSDFNTSQQIEQGQILTGRSTSKSPNISILNQKKKSIFDISGFSPRNDSNNLNYAPSKSNFRNSENETLSSNNRQTATSTIFSDFNTSQQVEQGQILKKKKSIFDISGFSPRNDSNNSNYLPSKSNLQNVTDLENKTVNDDEIVASPVKSMNSITEKNVTFDSPTDNASLTKYPKTPGPKKSVNYNLRAQQRSNEGEFSKDSLNEIENTLYNVTPLKTTTGNNLLSDTSTPIPSLKQDKNVDIMIQVIDEEGSIVKDVENSTKIAQENIDDKLDEQENINEIDNEVVTEDNQNKTLEYSKSFENNSEGNHLEVSNNLIINNEISKIDGNEEITNKNDSNKENDNIVLDANLNSSNENSSRSLLNIIFNTSGDVQISEKDGTENNFESSQSRKSKVFTPNKIIGDTNENGEKSNTTEHLSNEVENKTDKTETCEVDIDSAKSTESNTDESMDIDIEGLFENHSEIEGEIVLDYGEEVDSIELENESEVELNDSGNEECEEVEEIERKSSIPIKENISEVGQSSNQVALNSVDHILTRCNEILNSNNEAKRLARLENKDKKKDKKKKKNKTMKNKNISGVEECVESENKDEFIDENTATTSKTHKKNGKNKIKEIQDTHRDVPSKLRRKLPANVINELEMGEGTSYNDVKKIGKKIKDDLTKQLNDENHVIKKRQRAEEYDINKLDEPQPKNKKMKLTKINSNNNCEVKWTASGLVKEAPLTPKKKNIVNGFVEEPITPNPIDFDIKTFLNMKPYVKPKKIKRTKFYEDAMTILPKPKWKTSSSGEFLVEEYSVKEKKQKHLQVGSNTTDFIVTPSESNNVKKIKQFEKEKTMDFKSKALFNERIQRESSKALLQRKERQGIRNQGKLYFRN